MRTHIFLALLISALLVSHPQAQEREFGDVTISDFSAYDQKYDSTMPAIVLFETGRVSFDEDYTCYLKIHRRLLILNEEGLEYTNIEIPLLESLNQDVDEIKAATYNVQADNTVIKSAIGRKDILKNRVSEKIRLESFTLPNAKKRSIIEYSYRKKLGPYYAMPDWQFHGYIPINYSELTLFVPNALRYRLVLKGEDSLDVHESESGNYFGHKSVKYTFGKRDLYPVVDLPLLINREDYITEIKTQLTGTRIGYYPVNYFENWEKVAKHINDIDDFGRQRLNRRMKEKVNLLTEGISDDLQKFEAIYEFVSKEFTWNGSRRIFTGKGIRDTFKDREGNTADINLMLVEMLRYVGLKASPALISTKDNGTVLTDFPIPDQFNMMVAVVEFGESAITVDATKGNRSYLVPSPEIVYRKAFVIREDDSFGWLTTMPLVKTANRTVVELEIIDSDSLKANITELLTGMYAEYVKKAYDSEDLEEFWEDELSGYDIHTIESMNFENVDTLASKIKVNTELVFSNENDVRIQDDLIYLNPFTFLKTEENPLQSEKRDLPVEFYYPHTKVKMVSLKIPEGFTADEVPESRSYNMPEDLGFYRFQVTVQNELIVLVSHLEINAIKYEPYDYDMIRYLFQLMVDTQNETIVLKREADEEIVEGD